MNFEREIYDIKFTEDCKEEIFEIYNYFKNYYIF